MTAVSLAIIVARLDVTEISVDTTVFNVDAIVINMIMTVVKWDGILAIFNGTVVIVGRMFLN